MKSLPSGKSLHSQALETAYKSRVNTAETGKHSDPHPPPHSHTLIHVKTILTVPTKDKCVYFTSTPPWVVELWWFLFTVIIHQAFKKYPSVSELSDIFIFWDGHCHCSWVWVALEISPRSESVNSPLDLTESRNLHLRRETLETFYIGDEDYSIPVIKSMDIKYV